MRPVDVILISVVSGEAGVVLSTIGWAVRRFVRQVDQQQRSLDMVVRELDRHLSWHQGIEDLPRR